MYKIFARPIGTIEAPSSESYNILMPVVNTSACRVIFDSKAPNVSQYIQSASLEMGAEIAGKCSFVMSKGHPFYDFISPFHTEILVYERDTCIWIGRVIDADTDMYNNMSVMAEGALAVLNDIYVTAYNEATKIPRTWSVTEVFQEYIVPVLLNGHYVDEEHTDVYLPLHKNGNIMRFECDEENFDSSIEVYLEDGFDYCSVKEVLSQIITKYGGCFYVEPGPISGTSDTMVCHLKYVASGYPSKLISTDTYTVTFTAKAGINITSLNRDYNIEEFATAVLPLGKCKIKTPPYQGTALERYGIADATVIPSGFGMDMSTYDNRLCYLYNEDAVRQFGWIEKVVIYDDLTTANAIIAQAATDLALYLTQAVSTTIEFDSLIGNDQLKRNNNDTGPVWPRIFDRVKVIAPFNGINLSAGIQFLDLNVDILNPTNSKVTLNVTDYRRITKLIK